jgi:hypothetical protein
MSSRPRIDWRAASDLIAHAHRSGPRTVCGQLAVPKRLAWPPERRCTACDGRVQIEEAASCRR